MSLQELYRKMQWAKENAENASKKVGRIDYEADKEIQYLEELCDLAKMRLSELLKPSPDQGDKDVRPGTEQPPTDQE